MITPGGYVIFNEQDNIALTALTSVSQIKTRQTAVPYSRSCFYFYFFIFSLAGLLTQNTAKNMEQKCMSSICKHATIIRGTRCWPKQLGLAGRIRPKVFFPRQFRL